MHCPLSKQCAVDDSRQHRKFGNAENRTQGCWVRSIKHVLCAIRPPVNDNYTQAQSVTSTAVSDHSKSFHCSKEKARALLGLKIIKFFPPRLNFWHSSIFFENHSETFFAFKQKILSRKIFQICFVFEAFFEPTISAKFCPKKIFWDTF